MHAYPNPDKPEPNSKFEARNPKQIEDPCSKLQGIFDRKESGLFYDSLAFAVQKRVVRVRRLIATSIKQRRVILSRIDRPHRPGESGADRPTMKVRSVKKELIFLECAL
jgi:hypothetical protein